MSDSSSQLQQGYVSLNQLVKVGDESILVLNIHVLPNISSCTAKRQSPYAWFSDYVNQELLACVHELLHAKATANIAVEFGKASESNVKKGSTGQFQFRKSSSFRGLFTFKSSSMRHQILLPNESTSPSASVCATIISEQGRKVLPFFASPSKGQGYSSFRMLPESLHAYVDSYEASSSLGIFKVWSTAHTGGMILEWSMCIVSVQILKTLDPKHRVSLDIASYFRHKDTGQLDGEECFPEVPMAGLKTRRSKQKQPSAKASKQKSKDAKPAVVPSNQPLIAHALRDAVCRTSPSTAVHSGADTPTDLMDELFDFKTQSLTNEGDAPVISSDSDNCRDDTPPLDTPPPPRKKFVSEPANKGRCKPVALRGKSVTELIKHSGLQGKSLVVKKKTLSIVSLARSPLKRDQLSPVAAPVLGTTNDLLEVGTEQQEFKFSSPDEDCLLETPPTPSLVNPTCVSDDMPATTEQNPFGVGSDGVSSDGVCTDSVCGEGERKLSHLLSPTRLVLDDVTNKSPTPPASSVSSAESATSVDILEVSSEEEVVCTGSEGGRGTKSLKSLEEILDGIERVSDLTRNKIIQWLRLRRPVILDIFKGRIFSQRHTDYMTSGKKRAALVHHVDTSMFTEEGLSTLHTNLLKMFCSKDMKYFDYVMSVLVSECVVRIIADINRVSFEEAEKLMYSYGYNDSIDLSIDMDD